MLGVLLDQTDRGEEGAGLIEAVLSEVGCEDEEDDGQPTYPEVERRVNSAYRLHLDRKHGEIEKLQGLLAQKATEAMAHSILMPTELSSSRPRMVISAMSMPWAAWPTGSPKATPCASPSPRRARRI